MNLNLIRNGSFQSFTGGRPTNYSVQTTATTLAQLLKTDPIESPRRSVFQPLMKSKGQYIYEGQASLRATLTAAAVADDFRMWPFSEFVGHEFDSGFLGPFRIITGTNDVFRATEGAGTADRTLTQAFYTPATLATELKTQLEVGASANTYTWTWHPQTRLWTVTRTGGADAISLLWSHANTTAEAILGFDAVDDAAATTYTGDFPSPLDIGSCYRTNTNHRISFQFVARGTLANALLRLRVVAMVPIFTVASHRFLAQVTGTRQTNPYEWTTVNTSFITFKLMPWWTTYAVHFRMPSGFRWWMWQISNGTAGAQTIDFGEIRAEEQTRRLDASLPGVA